MTFTYTESTRWTRHIEVALGVKLDRTTAAKVWLGILRDAGVQAPIRVKANPVGDCWSFTISGNPKHIIPLKEALQ